MRKRIVGIVVMMVVSASLLACGKEEEQPTAAPAAVVEDVKAVSEQAVSASAVSGEAASGDAAEPDDGEEPFVMDDGSIDFYAEDIKPLLEACIGIRDTSGYYLKCAKAADTLLSYAVENNLANQIDLSIQSFNAAFEHAYSELNFDQQKELYNNLTEDIMPMIMDSFQDPTVYKSDFKDAGVYDSMKKNLKDLDARGSWSVIWEAYYSVSKDKQDAFASTE